jgi:hypothetical protein
MQSADRAACGVISRPAPVSLFSSSTTVLLPRVLSDWLCNLLAGLLAIGKGQQGMGGGNAGIVFSPKSVRVRPGTVWILPVDNFRRKFVTPLVLDARCVFNRLLAERVKRFCTDVVIVIKAGIAHAGIRGDVEMIANPCNGGGDARRQGSNL